MKITNHIDEQIMEATVDIVAKTQEEVNRIHCALQAVDSSIIGYCENVSKRVLFFDILYIESIDKTTFAYTQNSVIELPKRLYEVEELAPYSFLRVSKSTVLNLSKVSHFSREFGGRVIANLCNQEKIVISRFYVKSLKEKLKGDKI